jgi:hypothetical protein
MVINRLALIPGFGVAQRIKSPRISRDVRRYLPNAATTSIMIPLRWLYTTTLLRR